MASRKRKEVEDPNNTWNMQLVASLLRHDTETAASLLEKGADINHYADDAQNVSLTPMLHVILHGGCDEGTLLWIASQGGLGTSPVNKASGSIFHYLAATESLDLLDKIAAIAQKHKALDSPLGKTLDVDTLDTVSKVSACVQSIHNHRPDIARVLIANGCQVPFADIVSARYTGLARACMLGDIPRAETLLSSGDTATQIVDGQTLVHLSLGQPALIEMLLERGASVHVTNDDGETPLLYVVKHRPQAIDLIEFLVSKGADVNQGDALGLTPLMHSLLGHTGELVKRFLTNPEMKVDVNARDLFGSTALHWAVTARQKFLVDLLLTTEGIDINAADGNGATALHRAATRGKLQVLQHLLLQPTIDVNLTDKNGNTALHCAVIQREQGCVDALLKRCSDDFLAANGVGVTNAKDAKKPAAKKGQGAVVDTTTGGTNPKLDVDAINNEGLTALQIAITVLRDTVLAAHLLAAGASVDRGGEKGGTLLHSAVWGASIEMTETLLTSGADASSRDDDDESPLHIAARTGSIPIATLLLHHRAIVDDQSSLHLRAPLHYACEQTNREMISLLLSSNADVSLRDRFARTPLHLLCVFVAKPGAEEKEVAFIQRRNDAEASAFDLIENVAPTDDTDVNGWLPIHAACSANLPAVVDKLIERGSPLTHADNRGWTPVHCAVAHGATECLKLILKAIVNRGMSVDEELSRVDVLDRYPMMIAAEFGQKEAARALIEIRK
ncbi:ankyrin repeat protein, putative [Bodo saltans]|uniref:Ankyrin repeat protein, putative n=1 Tax=Bodo saltans TaxID=75058 RepID=A0A0S4IHW3_BODSA|nr:ankyrin repeat protein, putative [Bodo saltans]|eukprot:CUE69682.1 ankyrin repeat protein, putative [Bodo saltans]